MIKHAKAINFKHQRLWLLSQKAIYWQREKTLLVADLHIGKSGHFRSNGIPVPQQVNAGNFDILDELVQKLDLQRIIFLGDLFHSHYNQEWQQFAEWRKHYPNIEVTLVMGNHDILPKEQYHASHVSVFKRLKMEPFLLVHDIETVSQHIKEAPQYLLGGHIHPAIKLRGKGRQSMKFPCFYFGSEGGILPAFGQFTGTAVIQPSAEDRTYLIVEDEILPAGVEQ